MVRRSATLVLLISCILCVPASTRASPSELPVASPSWTATATLYNLSQGRWVQSTTAEILDTIRGVLVFHSTSTAWKGATAVMQIRHVTWQGWHLVTMPPILTVKMTPVAARVGDLTFAAAVQLPLTLPIYYARAVFILTRGSLRWQVARLLNVRGRQNPSPEIPTLSVKEADTFCARQPHLRGLAYDINVRGYVVRDDNWDGGGPEPGLVLDKLQPVNWTRFPPVPEGHGIEFGALGGPATGSRAILRGTLFCDRGVAWTFSLGIFGTR
jgi:hypothetical protein